jgi:hypothetical protein
MRLIVDDQPKEQQVDVKELYFKYSDEYHSVFIEDFGEDGVFIYHSLGRSDYRNLVEDDNTSLAEKEEIICESCVLYPEDFDFENCDNAGLPSKLARSILEKSLLTNENSLQNTLHYFRDKLQNSINEQISCAIHEAFPEFEIAEIDNWDIAQTCEYMAKAEFILHNLRGVPLNPVAQEIPQEPPPPPKQNQKTAAPVTQEIGEENMPYKPKQKLTPEKMAELQRRFPTIDWANDSANQGIKGFLKKDVDARDRFELNMEKPRSGQEWLPEAMRDRFKVIGDLNEHSLDKKD